MAYKVVVIDDEMPARRIITHFLSNYPDFVVVAEASNGEDAIEICREKRPDVVFIDIHLQDMTGIEIASELIKMKKIPKIIFVTAYSDYALKAFEFSAIDYLLKPIDENRFEKCIKKLQKEMGKSESPTLETVEALLKKHLQVEHCRQKITLEKEGKLYVLSLKDLIYIETEERSTKVISKRGEFITNFSMTEWEERLTQYGFYRPHRSFLINLEEIDEIVVWFNNSLQVRMRGYEKNNIPISRNKVKEFKELVGIEN